MSGLALQTPAAYVVAAKILEEAAKRNRAAVNAAVAAGMDVGDRKVAKLTDQTAVGSVTYANGKTTARVTDERALRDWVADNKPGELVTIVRPAYVSALLSAAVKAKAPVDPATGEVVPGIEVGQGDPYLTVTVDPLGRPALEDAIRAELRANRLLALEGGNQ